MMSNSQDGRQSVVLRRLRTTLAYTLSTCFVFQPFLNTARAQQIVTDGRTQTNLATSGAVTDVTTKTIANGSAFNSFSKFDVDAGRTVNLYVPDQADRLVNIVRDKETSIDGILNTYKKGTVGGDVYFLNPKGIVVGQSGVINSGRLTLQTPTSEFAEALLNSQGAISHAKLNATLRGDVPLSPNGSVRILGEVNARDALIIQSATQQITGTVREGSEASRVIFEKVVNTEGVRKGANSVSVGADGTISLLGPGQAEAATVKRRKMIVVDTSAETRTETALKIREGLVDISTNTINGNNAYNSFSIFDVYTGQTVNLIVPSNVANLVNIVRDEQSDIDGQVNALKDGAVGGHVYFLNPHGVVVGATGIIRADRITIATPTSEDVDRLLKGIATPDQDDALSLANLGALQKNIAGIVNVKGVIEGKSGITLDAGNVAISGRLKVEGTGAAGVAPAIVVHTVGDTVVNGGRILAEGGSGRKGGTVEVRAGNNVSVEAGSLISVSGRGAGSDAGSAIIFARNAAEIGADASILALGGEVSGDGGFIEFSGGEVVKLAGGLLEASAFFGKGGEVLIDPADIVVSVNTCLGCGGPWSGALSAGTAFSLQATNSITIAENVFLSTRQVGGRIDRQSHATGASTGNSANLTLSAAKIDMKAGSALFAQATNGFAGGNVALSGKAISLDNAAISGADVSLNASDKKIDPDAVLVQVGQAAAEIGILNGSRIDASGKIDVRAVATAALADGSGNSNRPYLLSSANGASATVTIDRSALTAANDVSVNAEAKAVSLASDLLTDSVLPVPIPFDAAVGVSQSNAVVAVSGGSRLKSTAGNVDLHADSRAEVEASATARNITLGGVKLPYAAAISVGVLFNNASVTVEDSKLEAKKSVDVTASAKSENTTSFDILAGGSTNGALGIGFNYTDHTAVARVRNSDISAGEDVSVLAESIQRSEQAGTLSVKDRATNNILDLVGSVVTAVVDEFFTKDGKATATGKKIKETWTVAAQAAGAVDKLASIYSQDWSKQSGISGKRGGNDSVWAAGAGALVALNETSAEISAAPSKTASVKAGSGDVSVKSLSNALTKNTVSTKVAFGGEGGTATALALNLSYEDIDNKAVIGADDATGVVNVAAGNVDVFAGQFEAVSASPAKDAPKFITWDGEKLSASRFANGRTIIANARGTSKKTSANTYAIGIGVSTRDVDARVDNAALTLARTGALLVGSQNELSILYVEAGDGSDMDALTSEAAVKRLSGQLAAIQADKAKAKKDAEAEKAAATTKDGKAAADKKIEAADADLRKVAVQQGKVAATKAESTGASASPVASLGSTYTVGFNYFNQNTHAELGSGAFVGALGAITVDARSGIENGGLSTYATLNGGNAEKGSSGTAVNVGVNVLLGETGAKIAQRSGTTGADAANTLNASGNVSVQADNATSFEIVNESRTAEKLRADATSANLVTLSGGIQMLDTTARLERSVQAGGKLSVEAASANTLATYLAGSTAGGENEPATAAITDGLSVLRSITGYKDSDEEDASSGGSEVAENASLGIGAILNVAIIATALKNSAAMTKSAQKAMAAEENARKIMKEEGKQDFVLSAGFSYNSFDSVASTANDLLISANAVTVGAYNDTDADVSVESTSEFDEGAGATVLSVAANIANQDNRALVGANSRIVVGTGGLTVDASTQSRGDDDTLKVGTSEFFAHSTGKSGLRGKQMVISLGLNIVDFENQASIGDGAVIVSKGAYNSADQNTLDNYLRDGGVKPAVTVSSAGAVVMTAEGNASSGVNGLVFGSEDGILHYTKHVKGSRGLAAGFSAAEIAGPVVAGYLDARIKQRQDELTKTGSAAGEGKAKGFGLGINVGIVDVLATIGANNTIVGVGALTVASDAQVRSSAKGVAGTGPSDAILSMPSKPGESATTALDAAAGINVVVGDVSADLGAGRAAAIRQPSATRPQALTGDGTVRAGSVTVAATTKAIAEAYSDGKAAGAEAADGASGALNLHNFDTTATLSASVRAFGDVSVTATADTVEIVKAEASARGTPVENYAAKLKTSVANALIGPNSGNANKSWLGRAKDRFTANYVEVGKQQSEEMSKAKSSQSFAAALGFNFADHDTRAVVADNVKIDTIGAIAVRADHDAMSMTEVSGAAVLSDKATGAAISGNVILSTVETRIGNNVVLGNASRPAQDVFVQAMSRFNTGVNVKDLLRYKTDQDDRYVLDAGGNKILDEAFPTFTYSSEAIAGAGGKGSSMAGALATTIYLGDTKTMLGNNVAVNTAGDAVVGAYDQSKIANKAWGVSVAFGTGTSPEKSARGGVGSVIFRGREVSTTIGSDLHLKAGGEADIVAKVLTPSEQWVGPESDTPSQSLTWGKYVNPVLGGDIAAPLRNADPAVTQSMHNQAIAAAAAGQSTQASYSGSLGLTIAKGVTKVVIGQHADLSAKAFEIGAHMNQEILGVGGSLAVSLSGSGGVFGAQAAVNVVLDDVLTDIGAGGAFVATNGKAAFGADANTQAMTITAVASLSGAGGGTTVAANLSSNTFGSAATTRIGNDVSVKSTSDLSITSRNAVDAFAFAGALGVSFGSSNPIAATVVSNVQLSSAESTIGRNVKAESGAGSVAVKAATDERLLSIPVAGGGLTGVLSVTVVNSKTRAIADRTSTLNAKAGRVSVTAENASDVLEIAGSVAFSMNGTALGLTMPGTGIGKTVEAQIGNAEARNIEVAARAQNNIRQLAGAGSVSTSSAGIGGTLGVLVLDNNVSARIAESAVVNANGNVWLDAKDDSNMLQFGGAVGASTSTGVGASAAALVVLGNTTAEVGNNAKVTARGQEDASVAVTRIAAAGEAVEAQRTGIVNNFNQLQNTGTQFANNVKDAFGALADVGQSEGVRDRLLAGSVTTESHKGFVMTADGSHRAVEISLALGASTGSAAVGGVVDVGVFNSKVGAYVRNGASINADLSASSLSSFGAAQDVLISAQSTSRLVGFAGMAGASANTGVGGGATVNIFNGTTTASVDASAVVKARRDVDVSARRALDIGVGNFALGGGGTAGIGAAVNVSVINGKTEARLDGQASAWRDLSLSASETSKNTDVIGAVGLAGTAGVGGAVNVLVASSTTGAVLGSTGSANARRQTAIDAKAKETIGNIIVAGGAGGTAGVGASINVIDSRRGVSAYAFGSVNQASGFSAEGSTQDVNVEADSSIDMFRLVGGLGGGGVVGAGVSFDMATILNQTDAAIGTGAKVRAGGDVTVDAVSSKNFASNTIAGGGGGVVGVGGAVVINRTGSGNLNDYKKNDGSSSVDGSAMAGQIDGVLNTVKGSRIASSGNAAMNKTVDKANSATSGGMSGDATSISAMLSKSGNDRTSATIGDGAIVRSGEAVTLTANDFSRVYQLAGSIGGGGAVGVGLTVGVNDFASSAVTGIGTRADVQAGGALTLAAQNVAVLEAVNFAGAGGIVGVAGSVNYNRLRNTTLANMGAESKILASRASINATNEQNLAATTIGVAGGFVGAGVSFTHGELGGGASTTIGNGASVATTSGDLDVKATQRSRMSVDGLAGAGGAVAGQAAVSEVSESSDAKVAVGNNVTLDAAGNLSVGADNKAWAVSNVVGVAFGAVAAGYVHSYATSNGDALVAIGDGHVMKGASVDVAATIGELQDVGRLSGAATLATIAGDRGTVHDVLEFLGLARTTFHRAETFALAAAGGLGAAQGSNLKSSTDNDAVVMMGTGRVTARTGDVSIDAQNVATLQSKVIGLTVGAVSLGAHVAQSQNGNDSRVTVGSGISAARDIAILANTDTQATAQSFAVSGGVVSVGLSFANITDNGAATVALTGGGSKTAGDDIIARNKITIASDNHRRYDAKMFAFGVGLLGGGSGNTNYDITGASTVTIGDNRKIVAKQADDQSSGEDITIRARNTVAKDLFGDTNLNLKAYGAIAVAGLNSEIAVKTDTGVKIGGNTEIYSAGTMSVKSVANVLGDDTVNVDAAGAGAFATGKTKFAHAGLDGGRARSTVDVGGNSKLFAGDHLELAAVTDTKMATSGEGSAYGVAASLRVDSVTTSLSDNAVSIGSGTDVASFGDVFVGAGEDFVSPDDLAASAGDRTFGYRINSNDVSSRVVSIVGAAIGIPRDNISRATTDQSNRLSVASGATVRSGGDIHAAASDDKRGGATAYIDVRNYSATSFLSAFMDIRGVGVTTKTGAVKLDGMLETGIDRVRSISIAGSDMSSVTGKGYNWRKGVYKNGNAWVVKYDAPLGDVVLRSGSLSGAGRILTPRDADLRVVNSSANKLSITGLSIPYLVGGKLYVNGTQIKENASPLLGSIGYVVPIEKSTLAVLNTNAAGPDLSIDGAISNLGGSVTLANIYGSMDVRARVQAAELAILSGKDFRVDSDDDMNLGNDPIAEFGNVAAGYTSYTTSEDADQKTAVAPVARGNRGSIEALGSIYIKADGVNINGLIRSGVGGRDTTVTQAMLDRGNASSQKTRYATTGSEDDRYFQLNDPLGFDPLTATRAQLASISIDDIAEIPLFLDYKTGNIVAKNLQAEGGTVVIEGRIASTGRGQVEALDGFARFDINNRTSAALELRDIDTGDGVEGNIVFKDHNFMVGQNYLETRWARVGSEIRKYEDMSDHLTKGVANTLVASGAAAASYNPMANQRYKWTVDADYYDLERFYSHHEDKDDGEGDINSIINSKGGGSWSDVNYSWVRNKLTTRTSDDGWERFGDNHLSWSSPVLGNDPVGSLVVDSNDDSQFHYIRDVTEKKREIQNFQSETVCETRVLGICFDYEVRPQMDYRIYYHSKQTYSARADKTIGIGFFGSDTGRVAVDSQGDILVAGALRNISGETLLTSRAGGIFSAGADGVVIANNLTLDAATTIGKAPTDTFRINQVGDNAIVNAKARSVNLEDTAGNMRVGQITVDGQKTATSGDLSLIAQGDLDIRPSNMGSKVSAGQIHLQSRTGKILTNLANNNLDVDTDAAGRGTLSVFSQDKGSVRIRETSGDLRLGKVEMPGDLSIAVNGDLLNGNTETADLSSLDASYAEFLDSRGIGDAGRTAAETEKVNAAYAEQMTELYRTYWKMRGAGSTALATGDASLKMRVSAQAIAPYDPKFVYHVSDEDRAALVSNGLGTADIAAYEAKQTAFYHEANAKLGAAAKAPYDPNFAYVLTDADRKANTAGLTIDRAAILSAVNSEVVGGNAAASSHSSNVKAGGSLNVTVSGTVGEEDAAFRVNAGNKAQISVADMQKMRNAKVGEVQYNADGSVTVSRRDGVSINAGGRVDVKADANAFLESQGDLHIGNISVGDTLQLKTSGDLLNANTDGASNAKGRKLILSSAGEHFGSADKRFVTETTDDGYLQLRSGGAAYLEEQSGDMRLLDAAGPTLDLLANHGAIVAAFDSKGVEINGDNVKLKASGGIGTETRSLDVTTRKGGSIDFETPGDAYIYAPDQPIQVKTGVIGGISRIVSSSDILVKAGNSFSAKSIDWYAPQNVVFGEGSTVTSREGMAKIVAGGDLVMASGSTLDARNNAIAISTKGSVVLGHLVTSNAGDTAVVVDAGGSINGNGDDLADITLTNNKALASLTAHGGIGGDLALATDVARLSFVNTHGGNVAVSNARTLQLETARVGAGSSIDVGTVGDLAFTDVTAVDGDISLSSTLNLSQAAKGVVDAGIGSVYIGAGGDASVETVRTRKLGNILVGADGRLDLRKALSTVDGGIFASAGSNLTINASAKIDSSGGGDIFMQAVGGELTQGLGSLISSNTGSISLDAARDMLLQRVRTGGEGNIWVNAGDHIVIDQALRTVDGDISASAGSDITLAAGSRIEASGRGNISLEARKGQLTQGVASLISSELGSISLGAANDVLLQTVRTGGKGNIWVNAGDRVVVDQELRTADGDISASAGSDLTLAAGTRIEASGHGDISLEAREGQLTQGLGSIISSGTGSIGLEAEKDLFLQTVRTGGDGAIGIDSRKGNVLVNKLLSTEYGAIEVVGDLNMRIVKGALVRSTAGDIRMQTRKRDFVQEQGSMIDSGQGRVRIHGGFNVQLRDVRSTYSSRFRIIATADNYVDDGGNYHRNVLDARLAAAQADRTVAPELRLFNQDRYLAPLAALQDGNGLVVNLQGSPIVEMITASDGAIALSSGNQCDERIDDAAQGSDAAVCGGAGR